MKICVLRSGSSGNCTYIEYDGMRLLLDAGGMSQRRMREILNEIAVEPEQIDALLVTHTHSDHVNYSSLKVCEKCDIPVYIHKANTDVLPGLIGSKLASRLQIVSFDESPFEIDGKLQVIPFEVSHDAPKVTNGFSIMASSGEAFTYAADLGCFPESLAVNFARAQIVFLEANHDVDMLWKNPNRPYVHKKRVTGNYGHLSNEQSGEALLRIFDKTDTLPQRVVLCHLSQDHNTPEIALETIGEVIDKGGASVPLTIAPRHEPTVFFELENA